MDLKNFFQKKFFVLFILFLSFAATGLLEPDFKSRITKNWDDNLSQKIFEAEEIVQSIFNSKIEKIISVNNRLKKEISQSTDRNSSGKFFETLNNPALENYSIQLYSGSKLTAWNSEPVFGHREISSLDQKISEAFFTKNKLVTYLTFVDTLRYPPGLLYLVTSIPVEKHYKLANESYSELSITDTLSSLLSTSILVDFSETSQFVKDGRKHSFPVLNNYKNKIGIAVFEKPSLDNALKETGDTFFLIQAFIVLVVYIYAGYALKNYFAVRNNKAINFLLLITYLIFFRMILFWFEIPSSFVRNSLTDPSLFSSVFAFGVVRSPLEFFITLVFALVISFVFYKRIGRVTITKESPAANKIFSVLLTAVSILLILLIIRGLGASIRSVVFDSTIRYFKEFMLIPPAPVLLMNVNILILGLCCFLVCVSLIILLLKIYSVRFPKTNLVSTVLFIAFQIAGWIYDLIQRQPQGTSFTRILILTLLLVVTFIIYNKKTKILGWVYLAFASSITVVSLLSFYNSEIERESLKTTAQEITRNNSNILEFIVHQTLAQAEDDQKLLESLSKKKEVTPEIFRLWTRSLIHRENIPSFIAVYDADKKIAGSFANDKFDTLQYKSYIRNLNGQKLIKIANPYTSEYELIGIVPIEYENETIGYLLCSLKFREDGFNSHGIPKFLSAAKAGISSATDPSKLKIYFFEKGWLINTNGTNQIDQNTIKKISKTNFSKHNEAWLSISINRQIHLVYLLKYGTGEEKIVAVALEENKFAWNLSNFFKVFFIHTLIISALFCIYSFRFLKKWRIFFGSFRTKIAFVLIIVSAVPMIVIAVYIRNISESKDVEITRERLAELAHQVDSYIKKYYGTTSLSDQLLFEKTFNDLNINFSVYENGKLFFNSDKNYYSAGLFPEILNSNAALNSAVNSSKEIFFNEKLDKIFYHSFYLPSTINSRQIIIQVNDLFNKIAAPLSNNELDVFLFGVFSLALILLIILSAILARQISAPINNLTLATRSIGAGDLNVEVGKNYSGEIKELAEGFNMMVKQLKKSQIEMALLERESAWKEMAKQVAHEIKNPLTPMKLSVQQLTTAYKDKSPKFDSIFEKVTSTITTQIETLKNIATEFSNFARMPAPNIEKVNVAGVINNSLNLFVNEKLSIKFRSDENIFVEADADHLSRTIINLVRNSIQANAKSILIQLKREENLCSVRLIDDGTGIAEEAGEKIFEENFTTKAQGMGLGLSMAKKFIESINGTITVEKTSSEGTTFLITIPVAE
ncbi:MAG: HAMP domain-containing histidine kinase [Ignavibacteriales bacterium]|nr:HAMP domain-containing histidine kinase [Ignavibacteriales bacterium]